MKSKNPFQFESSIRTRLLFFSVGLALLSVAVIAYITIDSLQTAGERAQQTSEASLRKQTEEFLLSQIIEATDQDDLVFERVERDAENLAYYAARLFEEPDAFARDSYWRADEHMFLGPDGQYINSEEDTSTVFVPNTQKIDDALIQELELSAYLDMIFSTIYENDPNTVAVYLITQKDISRLYPNINLGTLVPGDYSAIEDIFFTLGAPDNNPERNTIWTPVYDDPAGQGLLISVIAPVFTGKNNFIGVIGIDVSLAGLTASVEAEELTAGGYSLLIDQNGRALALPGQGYTDILGRTRAPGEIAPDIGETVPEFSVVFNDLLDGKTEFHSITIDKKELFVVNSHIITTGWTRVNVVEADTMLAAAGALEAELDDSTRSLISGRVLPTGIAIVILVSILGTLLTNRLVDPIQKLTEGAQRIGAGEWDAPLPAGGQDEVGTLSNSIREMSNQIRGSIQGLEKRVADRTRALETSTEVSRRLSTILNRDQLAKEVVEQLVTAFDYYYAHIYFYGEDKNTLVMMGGTGEAGQVLLSRGHTIEKGRGLVGRAAETNSVVLVADTLNEEGWLPNELLPETRSEIAVPISIGDEVLGVFDVQHNVVDGITEEDASLLQSIANQVAVAVQNAQVYVVAQKRAAHETLVGNIGQKIQNTTTVEDALQVAVRELGRALNAERSNVQLNLETKKNEQSGV